MHFMLERYAAESAVEPMSFREWVETRYDREALMAEYRSGGAADFIVDKVFAAGVRAVSPSSTRARRRGQHAYLRQGDGAGAVRSSGDALRERAAEEELADAGVGEERAGAVLHPGLAEDEAEVGHGD